MAFLRPMPFTVHSFHVPLSVSPPCLKSVSGPRLLQGDMQTLVAYRALYKMAPVSHPLTRAPVASAQQRYTALFWFPLLSLRGSCLPCKMQLNASLSSDPSVTLRITFPLGRPSLWVHTSKNKRNIALENYLFSRLGSLLDGASREKANALFFLIPLCILPPLTTSHHGCHLYPSWHGA